MISAPPIQFADGRRIGADSPCFVIAEAGVNHNGNRDHAHRLIDAAADCGADAVKFQTWITEELCTPGAAKAEYQHRDGGAEEDQFEMLKRLELPFDWHPALRDHARERGILFLSTPDEILSARYLCDIGIEAIKIGSGEVTNTPYLRELAALGSPLILSTGMANLEEVARAVEIIRGVSATLPLALLHCVSAYPAREEEMNLRAIVTLREAFGVPSGLSDHTTGNLAAVIGTALGMSVYERHLTLDRSLPGPDQAASTEPGEFAEIIRVIRKTELMLGSGIKMRTPGEEGTAEVVRRVLVYTKDLFAGDLIGAGDLNALRAGKPGFAPDEAASLTGRKLARAVKSGEPAVTEDFA
jgi:N,N'-diacetyllegionaminate synthase